MNPVLQRLLAQRAEQVTFIEQLLTRVESEERDLVDAERANINASRERIAELDEQITPLEQFEQIAAQHRAAVPPAPRQEDRQGGTEQREQRLGIVERPHVYESVGHFIVDKIRAAGYPAAGLGPDPEAAKRVQSAMQTRANETTTETPGILPTPIVGQVVDDLDGSRPLIDSFGAKALPSGSGKTFSRPIVQQHTQTGVQANELDQVTSRQYKIGSVEFGRQTFGSTLTVSRQDIDWTSPSAWNALMSDFVLEYGADTEDATATEFATGVTQTLAVTDASSLSAWITALYQAAVKVATANGTKRASALRLPDHMWVSVDMWATLGAVISAVRAQNAASQDPGDANPATFVADILDIPRTMSPGLPDGSLIVGRTSFFEYYEERIGLLQAIVPSQLGVQVAYGGYSASGFLDATAFTKITAPAA